MIEPRLRGQVIEIGGPANVTLNEMAERFEIVTGRGGVRSHAPVPMMRLMSLLLKPIKPVLAAQINAGVIMDTRDTEVRLHGDPAALSNDPDDKSGSDDQARLPTRREATRTYRRPPSVRRCAVADGG